MREFTVGRSAQADVTIANDTVSGIHLKVVVQPGRITLVDLGSTNGTKLKRGSEVNLAPQVAHEVRADDTIILGHYTVPILTLVNQFNQGGGGVAHGNSSNDTSAKTNEKRQKPGISRYIRHDDGTFEEN